MKLYLSLVYIASILSSLQSYRYDTDIIKYPLKNGYTLDINVQTDNYKNKNDMNDDSSSKLINNLKSIINNKKKSEELTSIVKSLTNKDTEASLSSASTSNDDEEDDDYNYGKPSNYKDPYTTRGDYTKYQDMPSSNRIPLEVKNFLKKHGDQQITKLEIHRTALAPTAFAINVVTQGEYNKLVKESGYKTLYHVSLAVYIGNKKYRIEKRANVAISEYSHRLNEKIQLIDIPDDDYFTLNSLFSMATDLFGSKQVYDYSPFYANCQTFVANLLFPINILTSEQQEFVLQDLSKLEGLPENLIELYARICKTAGDADKAIQKVKDSGKKILSKIFKRRN